MTSKTYVRKLTVLAVGVFVVLSLTAAVRGGWGEGPSALIFLFVGAFLAYGALRMP